MWLPTIGKITGFVKIRGGIRILFRSHTGKSFDIETTYAEAADKKIGDIVFCNGEREVWYPSYESALKRLEEVSK